MFRHSKNQSNLFRKIILSITASGGLWLGGLGVGYWLIQGTIAPLPVQAATERRSITVTRQFNETYQSMLRRAEATVRATAQQMFDQNVLTTDITVEALGQNNGTITSMFTLEVSRPNWRTSPNPERWARYYSEAQSLLNLSPRTTATTTTTPTAPTVAPAALPLPQTRPSSGVQPVTNPATTNPSSTGNQPANDRPPEEELVIF